LSVHEMSNILIESIEISEFRGIRKLKSPLNLTSFNVLIGRNNVGKSAVLEALYFLTRPHLETVYPYWKNIFSFIAGLHGGSSSLIYGYAGEAVLKYSLRHKSSVRRVRIVINRNGLKSLTIDEVEADPSKYVKFLNSLGLSVDTNILALYIPNNSSAYSVISRFMLKDEVWSYIEKRGLHSKVVKELLAPALYDRFTEVTIKKNKLCIRKEVSETIGPLYIDVNSLGEGVKRCILAYLAIEYLNPRVVLWDDIEVAVHPSLLETMLKWLANSGRQVVLTTHSIDVLHTLTRIQPKDLKVIVLKKSREDVVQHQSLTLDEVEDLFESGIDLRKIIEELKL